jgi:Family of unknown function (DUF6328)
MSESPQQRENRELIELLNELRVALPGVQVLFAFLLAVPFANGFPKLSGTSSSPPSSRQRSRRCC